MVTKLEKEVDELNARLKIKEDENKELTKANKAI